MVAVYGRVLSCWFEEWGGTVHTLTIAQVGTEHWKTSNLNKVGGDLRWPSPLHCGYLELLLVAPDNYSFRGVIIGNVKYEIYLGRFILIGAAQDRAAIFLMSRLSVILHSLIFAWVLDSRQPCNSNCSSY